AAAYWSASGWSGHLLRAGLRWIHRLGTWLGLLAGAESLHRVLQLEGVSRRRIDALLHAAVAVQIQRDLVLARLDVQSLEHPVEVVDDAGVVPIDVDLRVFRSHLDPDRSGGLVRVVRIPERRRPERILIAVPVPRVVPERVRIEAADDHDATRHAPIPASLSLGSRGPD